jgi:protein gp37
VAENSKIGWCHHTHNIAWGCQKVSEECDHCYAEVFAKRVGLKIWGPAKTTTRRILSDRYWLQPLKWDRAAAAAGERHRVFCSSMADVLEDHPTVESQRPRLWELIGATPNLDWLLLTKRPENAPRMLPETWWEFGLPTNVWFGTTAGNQKRLDQRWPHLRAIPARVRFVSIEPMLGPVRPPDDAKHLLHWAIIGGETAPDGVRTELDVDAAVDSADRFHDLGIPVFTKQDSGRYPGQRGRLPDWLWSLKQFPRAAAA